jgi:uncharacterized protein YvpB
MITKKNLLAQINSQQASIDNMKNIGLGTLPVLAFTTALSISNMVKTVSLKRDTTSILSKLDDISSSINVTNNDDDDTINEDSEDGV